MTMAAAELLKELSKDERLSRIAISDTGFIFDPQTGQSFTLNRTGLVTLSILKRGSSIDETAEQLSHQYGITEETAVNSVEAFLLQLGRYL